MLTRKGVTAAELIVWLTLGTCVLAVFEPRLRKACIGLLCRL